MLMREPGEFGIEGADQPLTFGPRLIEVAEGDGRVADDDVRATWCLDDDHLRAAGVTGRRDEPNAR